MFRNEQIKKEIDQYFIICDNSYTDKNVYTASIRSEYCIKSSDCNKVILKGIDHDQAMTYKKISSVWSPYLESIYGIYEYENEFISINEFIQRPSCFNYEMYDTLYLGNEHKGLSLADYIDIDKYAALNGKAPEKYFIDEATALQLVYHLCEGIEELEKAGLTHGDISPQNIMLTDKPAYFDEISFLKSDCPFILKLIDYGTAKTKKTNYHAVTNIIGTQLFAAPEILTYNKPTDRIDIYALGCILHYMCLGISPVENGLYNSKRSLSRAVYNIVRKCNNDYDTRYHNISQLKRDILKALKMPVSLHQKIIRKLPGFRQGKLLNMMVASYFYFAMIIELIINIKCHADIRSYEDFLFAFVEICLVFDAFNIKKFFPKYCYWRERIPFLIIITRFFIFIITCTLWGIYWGLR